MPFVVGKHIIVVKMLTYVLCSIDSVVNWRFKTSVTWLVALGGKVDHGYINLRSSQVAVETRGRFVSASP